MGRDEVLFIMFTAMVIVPMSMLTLAQCLLIKATNSVASISKVSDTVAESEVESKDLRVLYLI